MDQGKATGSPSAKIVTPVSSLPWQIDLCGCCLLDANGNKAARSMVAGNALIIRRAVNRYDGFVNALEQIAIVCTDNMDRDCNHRLALDFVRQIANDCLDASSSSGPMMTDDSSRKDSGEVNQ